MNLENLTVRCECGSPDGRGRMALVLNVEALSYCETGPAGMVLCAMCERVLAGLLTLFPGHAGLPHNPESLAPPAVTHKELRARGITLTVCAAGSISRLIKSWMLRHDEDHYCSA